MPARARPVWTQVVLDTTDTRRSAEFWRQLLDLAYPTGGEPPPEDAGEVADWLILRRRDGGRQLAFQLVPVLRRTTWPADDVPQQLHLDLAVASVDDLEELRDRALSLGADELHDRRGDAVEPLVVLADPMGHPFCIFVTSDHGG